jgi:hypothetical protein
MTMRLTAVAAAAAFIVMAPSGCARTATTGEETVQGRPSQPQDGSTAPATQAAKKVDPCALVTKEEAERLAGTGLNDAAPVQETCTYTGLVSGPTAQVEVYVGDGAKSILDIDRGLEHDFKTLPGIADEAYAEDGAVFLNKGGQWVAIRLVRLDDPKKYAKPMEELARLVASRI